MKRNVRNAMNELKNAGVPVFERSDVEYFGISAEDEESYKWVDYYGEFRGGYPYVAEELTNILNKYGLYAEWENPGALIVYDV